MRNIICGICVGTLLAITAIVSGSEAEAAFATWALDSYEEVYIVDYRMFNGGSYGGFGSAGITFRLSEFYDFAKFDDLVIISYPVSISAGSHVNLLGEICQ